MHARCCEGPPGDGCGTAVDAAVRTGASHCTSTEQGPPIAVGRRAVATVEERQVGPVGAVPYLARASEPVPQEKSARLRVGPVAEDKVDRAADRKRRAGSWVLHADAACLDAVRVVVRDGADAAIGVFDCPSRCRQRSADDIRGRAERSGGAKKDGDRVGLRDRPSRGRIDRRRSGRRWRVTRGGGRLRSPARARSFHGRRPRAQKRCSPRRSRLRCQDCRRRRRRRSPATEGRLRLDSRCRPGRCRRLRSARPRPCSHRGSRSRCRVCHRC